MERARSRTCVLAVTDRWPGSSPPSWPRPSTSPCPLIESEFHVSAVTLGWISLAYILAAGAVLMPVGRIADLYGRKRIFLVGMVVFTVIAFASALSPSASVLIVLRVLQGLATALLFATHHRHGHPCLPPETRGTGAWAAGGRRLPGPDPRSGAGRDHHPQPGMAGPLRHRRRAGRCSTARLAVWKLRGVEWREPKTARFDVLGSVIWAVALSGAAPRLLAAARVARGGAHRGRRWPGSRASSGGRRGRPIRC